MIMSDTNKDADVTGVGETQNGIDTRRPWRRILVAVGRLSLAALILIIIFKVASVLTLKWV